MKYLLLLLYLSAFISITLMEGLILLTLAILLYQILREGPKLLLRGSIAVPLHMYISTTVVSTILFFPKMALKALGEGLFQLTYFFMVKKEHASFLAEKIPIISVGIGVFLLPVLMHNSAQKNDIKLLWGGVFEVGNFYSLFAIYSFLLAFYKLKGGARYHALVYLILSVIFVSVVFYSTRRSSLLALFLAIIIVLVLFYRNSIVSRKSLASIFLICLAVLATGYIYLSHSDPRIKLLNSIISGNASLSESTINEFSLNRFKFFLRALDVIQIDLMEKNLTHLLIGHGIRSGFNLPHPSLPKGPERYESIFIVSEFIEKGLIGVIGEIMIIFIALKRFLSIRIKDARDLPAIMLFIPFLHHLGATIFTLFWDAVLPVYLLLFKTGEIYFSKTYPTISK